MVCPSKREGRLAVVSPWADFKLFGYGADEEILFESGKRIVVDKRKCKPPPETIEISTEDHERSLGEIEIAVGDLVLRVWDADALRTVVDALT